MQTLNYLCDPDPPKLTKKIKNDPFFKTFLSSLSFRDRCIARVIYYSNLTLSEVLRLTIKDISNIKFPETLMLDIILISENRNESELLFINKKGKKVNYVHFCQALKRATVNTGVNLSTLDLRELSEITI